MASDYYDALEMGETPTAGSENWISPFAQDAFNRYLKPDKSLSKLIRSCCSLEIS